MRKTGQAIAGIMRVAPSPARRDSRTEEGEGDVTRASAVGADVWTPHVSDWKGKKKGSAYRSALGGLMLGRCARGREGKKGRAWWVGLL